MEQAAQPAVRLCGRFEVTLDGQPVTRSLPGRQGRLIVAYLTCNRSRSVTRDELIDLLWPSQAPANPGDVLGALLSKLRRALGAGVLQGRREVMLELPGDTSIDLELAHDAVGLAEAKLDAGVAQPAFDQARAAGELLAGQFLPGYAGPWVEHRRRDVEELRLRALECVARAGLALDRAELASAETAARALTNAEPLRERGYRLLMDVLAARGDCSAALQAYEQLRIRLRDELGVIPGAAIRARHGQLLAEGDLAIMRAEDPSERPAAGLSREPRFPQTVERRRIAASKLSPPLLRPGIVDRPSLIGHLLGEAHASTVVISAPGGYGKTTLLALWRSRDARPFGWVSLDTDDNDPVALLSAVITALHPILGLDDEITEALAVPEPSLQGFVLPSLMNACADAGRDFVLVLDDLHRVTDERSIAIIEYLARRLPTGCQLALATRVDPTLPLASLRAHGRLAEVRMAELALDDAEAKELLDAAGVRLTRDRIADLVQRTEGWPAAIYLAAMSLRGRPEPQDFVDQFAGTTRHVAEFLAEDVLAHQPDEVTDFLLRTCVLDELTGSLCDAVTGRRGAHATLRELERSNLFVVAVDEDRLAYRYHHLVAQYLRAELARRDPDLARELHRRAWRWYRARGLVGRAVTHAQASGDVDVAAELVAAVWQTMSERGQARTVLRWIAGFSDAQVEAHPPLAIAAAWVCALTGDAERAARFGAAAQRGSWDGAMPDGTASLESALAIMSGGFGLGGLSGMRAAAQRAVDLEPVTSRWRPFALFILGAAEALQGDFVNARDALGEAVRLTGDDTTPGAASLTYLAVIAVQEGDDETAWRYAERSHASSERPTRRNYVTSVGTYSIVANLLSRRGEVGGAEIAIERANQLLPRLTEAYWWQAIETRIRLATALAELGRDDEAAGRLDEAAALLAGRDDTGALPEWHAEASLKLHDHRRQTLTRVPHLDTLDPATGHDEPEAVRDPAPVVPLRAAAE